MPKNIKIGGIYACIEHDHRYATRVEVLRDEDGNIWVIRSENGAHGGMDGDGTADPFEVRAKQNLGTDPAPALVLGVIKAHFDDTVKRYGKPTKKFSWSGTRECGLNRKLVVEALAWGAIVAATNKVMP